MSTLTDRREALIKALVAGEWSTKSHGMMVRYQVATPNRIFTLTDLKSAIRSGDYVWVVESQGNSIELGHCPALDEAKGRFNVEQALIRRAKELKNQSDLLERWLA